MTARLLHSFAAASALVLSLECQALLRLSTADGWNATHEPNTLVRVTEAGPLRNWLHFHAPKWKGPRSEWPAFECRSLPRDWSAYDRLVLPVLGDSPSGNHLLAVYVTDADRKLQQGAHTELRLKHPQARLVVMDLKEAFAQRRMDPTAISLLHIYTENPPADHHLYLGPPMLLTPQDPMPELPADILRLAKQRRIDMLQPLLTTMRESLRNTSLGHAGELPKRIWQERKDEFLKGLDAGRFAEHLLTHGTSIPDYQSLLSLARLLRSQPDNLPPSLAQVLLGLAPSTAKVLPKVPVFQPLPASLELDAARNECESLQLVLMPLQRNLIDVKLAFSRFSSHGNHLPDKALQAIPVGFVETTFNPPNGSPHVGHWPDPLLTFLDAVTIKAGDAQPFWIKASIPAGQPAGAYQGTVGIQAGDSIIHTLPMTVRVRDFTLPNHSLLPLAVTFGPAVRRHAHRMEAPTTHWRKHMKAWHDMLARYYLNFDHLYWDAPGDDCFPFWTAMKAQGKPVFFNLGNFPLASDQPQNGYGLQAVVDRIAPAYRKAKELGLLAHAYFYGADEVQKATFPRLQRTAQILHRHFPDVPVATTAADETYGTDSPATDIDRFCPLVSNYTPNLARLARRQGREVWWYVSNTIAPPYPNNFVESDAIEIRLLMGAMSHKYDVDGFLYYHTSMWNTEEPITDGPYTGMNARSYPRYNGDGNWCYQGPDNTPVPTIRLENFRDGLEDYAYLKLLQQRLLAARPRKLDPDWQEQARQALAVPPDLVADLTHFSRSPERLDDWKKRLAQLIEDAPALDCPVLTCDLAIRQRNQMRKAMERKLRQPITVQGSTGYNSWPMLQSIGNVLVCAYSKGTAHTIDDGLRGAYARISRDGGHTWEAETMIVDTPRWGEVPIGKGLDAHGDLLLWVRSWGTDPHHDLFRSHDGTSFEKIASLTPDPMPMQITDVIHVPAIGLMALWFTGDYRQDSRNDWGTLTSCDDGRTWNQHVVERRLPLADWPTEPSAVHLGDGRILAIARIERPQGAPGTALLQLESSDSGKTWTRSRTNITDVAYSTPSLLVDPDRQRLTLYYYVRGTGEIKRRIAPADRIWHHPQAWPRPELLAIASDSYWDAGNVNATALDDRHIVSFYAGDKTRTAVQVIIVKGNQGL